MEHPLAQILPEIATTDDLHGKHVRYALDQFRKKCQLDATHVVYAPGRVNLIGEHTDYNGGFVLPLAIELGVYVAARRRDDQRVRLWSAQQGDPAEFEIGPQLARGEPSWSNYVRGVFAGLGQAGVNVPGFEALISATLPAGGGLSSSAALEVAFATLGESLTGTTLDPVKKAHLCQKAEHEFAGTPCGIMDQFAVVFGKAGHLLLLDCQSLERQSVPMEGNDVSLLVINTMVKHELSDGGYKSRRDDCHEAARLLGVRELRDASPSLISDAQSKLPERLFRRARHVVTENARTLLAVEALRHGDWPTLGKLMYASHASLTTDFEVSCAELNAVVGAAQGLGIERGMYGCRMTGGGFGGCCVALVRSSQATEIEEEIRASFRAQTGIEPTIFATRPADGPAVLVHS